MILLEIANHVPHVPQPRLLLAQSLQMPNALHHAKKGSHFQKLEMILLKIANHVPHVPIMESARCVL